MRTPIVVGSLLSVFFLVMLSTVSALGSFSVAPRSVEAMRPLEQQPLQHDMISAYGEELLFSLLPMAHMSGDLCPSCSDNLWNPRCFMLLCRYMSLIPLIVILQTVPFFKLQLFILMTMADAIHTQARELGCSWALHSVLPSVGSSCLSASLVGGVVPTLLFKCW